MLSRHVVLRQTRRAGDGRTGVAAMMGRARARRVDAPQLWAAGSSSTAFSPPMSLSARVSRPP